MEKNYIITNNGAYFVEGSQVHIAYTFNPKEAARFTEFEANLKTVQMEDWHNGLEVIKIN